MDSKAIIQAIEANPCIAVPEYQVSSASHSPQTLFWPYNECTRWSEMFCNISRYLIFCISSISESIPKAKLMEVLIDDAL